MSTASARTHKGVLLHNFTGKAASLKMRHYCKARRQTLNNHKQKERKRTGIKVKKLTGETFVKIRWKKQQKISNEKNP